MSLLRRRSRPEAEPAFFESAGQLLLPGPEADCASGQGLAGRRASSAWFETCGNPQCRSGVLHLFRSRNTPVFEGRWTCSPECTKARVETAIRAEMAGHGTPPDLHRHRVPLGLVMLEQGWITAAELRRAVEAQRTAGDGRLGRWLVRQQSASEQMVTRGLAIQWNCPVFSLDFHDTELLAPLVPRLFLEAFGALPVRVGAGKILYMGFEQRLDPALALSVERITGLRVECGLIEDSHFRAAHARMLAAAFPPAELIGTQSEISAVKVISRAIEKIRPAHSRLVRVHDSLWLRLWCKPQRSPIPEPDQVRDLICTIGSH